MSDIHEQVQDQQAWQRADELELQREIVARLHKLDCGLGNHLDILYLAQQLGVASSFEPF